MANTTSHLPLVNLKEGLELQFKSIGTFKVGKPIGAGDQAVVYEAELIQIADNDIKLRAESPQAVIKIPHFQVSRSRPGGGYSETVFLPKDHEWWSTHVYEKYRWETNQARKLRAMRPYDCDETTMAVRRGFALSIGYGMFSVENFEVDPRFPSRIQEIPCMVQPYIAPYCLQKQIGRLRGALVDSGSQGAGECFWQLCENLATSLSNVHRLGLLHLDVLAQNVLLEAPLPIGFEGGKWINEDGSTVFSFPQTVFIDFGSASDRGPLLRMDNTPVDWDAQFRSLDREPFQPGISLNVQSDIYMLGRLFLRLAIGDMPLDWSKRMELAKVINYEVPDKPYIKHLLRSSASEAAKNLYDYNVGIADVIARCVWLQRRETDSASPQKGPTEIVRSLTKQARFASSSGRYTRTSQVLRDLRLFRECKSEKVNTVDSLSQITDIARNTGSRLIDALIDYRLTTPLDELKEWDEGRIAEFYGGHHDIVALRSFIFGALKEGDWHLAISPRRFWASGSNGLDGRVLVSQVLSAQAGVCNRRIHLENIEQNVSDEPNLDDILRIQSDYMKLLELSGVQVRDHHLEKGGFYTGRVEYERVRHIIESDGFQGRFVHTKKSSGDIDSDSTYRAMVRVVEDDGVSYYSINSLYVPEASGRRQIGFRIMLENREEAENFVTAYRRILEASTGIV